MKRALASALLVLSLTRPATAQERPKLTPIPPGDDKIQTVRQGEPAPFTGQLFDNATALRWSNFLEQALARWAADVKAEREKAAAEALFAQKRLDEQQAFYQAEVLRQQQFLLAEQQRHQQAVSALEAKLRDRPFYQSPWFGFTAGVVVSGALIGGALLLAK